MKIIGFVGSPRLNGNTQTLVQQVLDSAAQKGAETKIFNLNKLNIKGCQSCYYCKSNDGCAIKDDMQQILQEIKEAKAIIIGTPIYMWQMAAQTKILTDRLFACFGNDFFKKYGKKDLVLIVTHGNPNINMFKQYVDSTSDMFKFLGYNVKGTLIAGNTMALGVKDQKVIMNKAKNFGLELVN